MGQKWPCRMEWIKRFCNIVDILLKLFVVSDPGTNSEKTIRCMAKVGKRNRGQFFFPFLLSCCCWIFCWEAQERKGDKKETKNIRG